MAYVRRQELPCFRSYADAARYMDTTAPIRGRDFKPVPLVQRKYWRDFHAVRQDNGDIWLCEGGVSFNSIDLPPSGYPTHVKAVYHPDDTVTLTMHTMWDSSRDLMSIVIPGFDIGSRENNLWMRIRNHEGQYGDYLVPQIGSSPVNRGRWYGKFQHFRVNLVDGWARLPQDFVPVPVVKTVINRKAKNAIYKAKYQSFLDYMRATFHVLKDSEGCLPYDQAVSALKGMGIDQRVSKGEIDVELEAVEPGDLAAYYKLFMLMVYDARTWNVNLATLERDLRDRVIRIHPEILTKEAVRPGLFAHINKYA